MSDSTSKTMDQTNELPEPVFYSPYHAAARLGVSEAWLRAEAKAGRVPSIKVGKSIKIPLAECRAALLERAACKPKVDGAGS